MGENSFMSKEELSQMGFKSYGDNVLVSRYARFYNPGKISLGSNVRIDDFCILSGSIVIGDYVHIAAYCGLFGGQAGIVMEAFSGLSSRCAIYAESADYSGKALTNPTIPEEYRNMLGHRVVLHKHVVIGTGSSIMPGVTIGEGTAVGSMSLVNKSLEEWGIYVGTPCKKIKERARDLLEFEKLLKEKEANTK